MVRPKRRKKITQALVVALKKKLKGFLPFFPDFISILQTFAKSGKLVGKRQDFFKNSRLYEPWSHHKMQSLGSGDKSVRADI